MSRRLLLCLIAGIGAAALPIGLFADGDIEITTGGMSAGPGQIVSKQTTTIVNADGTVTQQSSSTSSTPAPTTQPQADATTQPAAAPATQPDAGVPAPAPGPAGQPNVVVQHNGNGFVVTTTGGIAAGPGQISATHMTMTITPGGASNITVTQSGNANPPATQPADANAPATQP